jgi:hypothetical protein
MKIALSQQRLRFTGPGGSLGVHQDDEISRRLAMLIEGQCEELESHYEHLPEKLTREGVNPRIPWLYNFQIDFRFK